MAFNFDSGRTNEEDPAAFDIPFLGSVPSGRQLADMPRWDSKAAPEGTRRAFLGAQTEVRNLTEQLTAAGYGEEVNEARREASAPAGMPLLDPLFDLLQIGQFTTVGFVEELQRTGNTGHALEQAAVEFANALPGIEMERARRPGWADVLRNTEMFNEDTQGGRWSSAGLGFAMDILLDPTTYTGFGTVKALKALRGMGGSAGLVDALARRSVPGAQGFGEAFLPHFQLRQFALRGGKEAKDAVEKLLSRKQDFFGERDSMMREMHNVVGDLRAGLYEDEARLITMFIDQPKKKFEDIIRTHLQQAGQEDRYGMVMEKAKAFRVQWFQWGKEEVKEGLLDKMTVRYNPLRDPQTGRTGRVWNDFVDGRIFPDQISIEEIDPAFRPPAPLLGAQNATFNHAKQYKTAQQRIAAGMPTELDVGLNTARRGLEHVRAMSTRRFLKGVVDDSEIVQKLDGADAEVFLRDAAIQRQWKEAGYIPVNLETLKKGEVDDTGAFFGVEFFDAAKKGDPIHMMPEVVVDHLRKANEVMSDGDISKTFWNSFKRMQGVWKGYALLSPGYHMRNLYSNFFQNWLAGVTHPKRYAMAMALQAGGTDGLPPMVRQFAEATIGRKQMDEVWMTTGGVQYTGEDLSKMIDGTGVRNTGLFSKDLLIDTEKEFLTSLEKNYKRTSLREMSTAGVKFEGMLREATDLSNEEVHTVALLWDARAKTWAWQNGKSVDDYFRTRIKSIERGGDEGSGKVVMYDKRSPPTTERISPRTTERTHFPEEDQLLIPHGDRVEEPLHKMFLENPSPSGADLRKVAGAPGYDGKIFKHVDKKLVERARQKEWVTGEAEPYQIPFDYDYLVKTTKTAFAEVGDQANWYREWGREAQEMVGQDNMEEFGRLFGIMSPQKNPEDNLVDAFVVMRLARQNWNGKTFDRKTFEEQMTRAFSGMGAKDKLRQVQMVQGPKYKGSNVTGREVQVAADMYENGAFSGNMKTTMFALNTLERAAGSRFFPFTVNDVHIARLFGYGGVDKKTGTFKHMIKDTDQYRFAQYMMAKVADDLGKDPDEVQAALWFYAKNQLAPKESLAHLGGKEWVKRVGEQGTWKSAKVYAQHEYKQLEKLLDKDNALPGLQLQKLKFEQNQFSSWGQDFVDVIKRIGAVSTRTGEQAFKKKGEGRYKGGLGVGAGIRATDEQLQALHQDVFERIAPDGETVEGLKELDTLFKTKHRIVHTVGSFEGKLEPNFSIVVEGTRSDTVGRVYSAVLGDALGQDAAVWYVPRRFASPEEAAEFVQSGGTITAGVAADAGSKITTEEFASLNEVMGKHGLDFAGEPGDRSLRFLNVKGEDGVPYSGLSDEDYYDKVTTALKKWDKSITTEVFTAKGGYHERQSYAEIIGEARGALARGTDGASDLAGRIYDKLHKQYDDAFSDHASRNGWDTTRGGGDKISEEYRARLERKTEVGSPLHGGLTEGPSSLFQEGGGRKLASVEFDSETGMQGLIRVFEGHDVSSILHESAHIWRRDLDGDDLATIEKWAGVKDGDWTVKAEERFARGFERYMREGNAPTPMLEGVFSKAKEWLENIYAVIQGSEIKGRINKDVRGVFDRMLGEGTLDGEYTDLTRDVVQALPVASGISGLRQKTSEVLSKVLGVGAPHMKANRVMGRAMENNARIAHLLDKFEGSNGNREFARDSVNKYLFDYENGLTEFEANTMRSLIPFYSWMRFNIPLQMQAIMEDPARYAKIPKFIQAIESVTNDWRGIETPDYYEELHAVRLPLIQNSKPVFVNPNLPFQDLNRLNSQDILSSMTPFAKLFGEMVPSRGYSTFTDRPIERFPGEESEVIPGLGKKTEHALATLLPTFGKVQRQFKAAGRDELPSQVLSEVAGIKLTNVDEGRVIRSNTFAQRELLRALKKRLEQDGVEFSQNRRRRRRRRRRQPDA